MERGHVVMNLPGREFLRSASGVVVAAVFGLSVFLPALVQAAVTSITVTPNMREVGVGQSSPVHLSWQVMRSASAGAGVVVSDEGRFTLAGVPVRSYGRTLSRRFSNGLTDTTLTITETLMVPRDLVIRAKETGEVLGFSRYFADDGVFALDEEVQLLVGASAPDAGVTRHTLHFDDGTDYRSVAKDGELRAIASIDAAGAGMLRAVWEVASNRDLADAPLYRPLQNITRPLQAGMPLRIESPPLPTAALGRVRVRLRVIAPEMAEDVPEIDYFVVEGAARAAETLPEFKPEIPASKGGGLR